ncbi:MAG: phosphate/phosphite/phosphonate ABC transporter substrate-binding protein [Nitrospiraceae bacterium]|nr:MAG: phosphate/phosphite/phosphonate ABC transporter substrate-binding protein [Nitrospiraceae bacterium]
MRPNFAFFVLIFLALLFKGSIAYTHESLVLGIHPYLPATELIDRFAPLSDYLSRKIGKPVVMEISKDYKEHIDKIGKNKVDIAFMGPVSYVGLVEKYGSKPILARLEITGKPVFMGAVITSKNSKIKTLADLKGKKFAFVDPESTMGHLVPRYMLLEAGVDVKDLAESKFLYNHHNVALGVLTGDFDAGAVKEDVFYEYEKRGLKVLAWTPPISEHVFVTSSLLPKETVRILQEALLRLKDDKEGKEILLRMQGNLTGLVPAVNGDYDNLRVILQKLKKIGIQP